MKREDLKELSGKELLEMFSILKEEKSYLDKEIEKMKEANEVIDENRTTKSL